MYVCICHRITDIQISEEVAKGADSLRELNKRLGVASQCGKCRQCAKQVLQQAISESCSAAPDRAGVDSPQPCAARSAHGHQSIFPARRNVQEAGAEAAQ